MLEFAFEIIFVAEKNFVNSSETFVNINKGFVLICEKKMFVTFENKSNGMNRFVIERNGSSISNFQILSSK